MALGWQGSDGRRLERQTRMVWGGWHRMQNLEPNRRNRSKGVKVGDGTGTARRIGADPGRLDSVNSEGLGCRAFSELCASLIFLCLGREKPWNSHKKKSIAGKLGLSHSAGSPILDRSRATQQVCRSTIGREVRIQHWYSDATKSTWERAEYCFESTVSEEGTH